MAEIQIDAMSWGRYRLRAQVVLPAPQDQVFAFFADASNLQTLMPASLNFQIVTPQPIEMCSGALIDYRLKLHGLPIRWRSKITVWDPPHMFEDMQIRGPYTQWVHRHTFEAVAEGTLAGDEVLYSPPARPIAPLLHGLFIRHSLQQIFACRHQALLQQFHEAG